MVAAGIMLGACSSAGAPVGTGVVPTTAGPDLFSECQAAGGTTQGSDPTSPSDCIIGGVDDQVSAGTFEFSPSLVRQIISECQGIGGLWSHIPFGGYYIDQTDWDCTVNGFQDQLVSFSSGTFDVPIGLATVAASLMHDCVQAGGELSLDTFGKTQPQPFACVLGGTKYDDLILTPQPHFVTPLDQAAQVPSGAPPSGTTGTTPPTPTTPPSGTTGTTPPS